MKRFIFNVFWVVAAFFSLVAMYTDRFGVAIWFLLVLIIIQLDEIHDTLKAHGITKGNGNDQDND